MVFVLTTETGEGEAVKCGRRPIAVPRKYDSDKVRQGNLQGLKVAVSRKCMTDQQDGLPPPFVQD
jgi:hypothetical protein